MGNCLKHFDDANIPSLISIPYFSNEYDKIIYKNTRKYLLNEENNNYYFKIGKVKGIGSPHTPPYYIWPIGLINEAITTNDIEEKYRILNLLIKHTSGTNLMHESFHIEDDTYTREWFAWANSYFSRFGNCLSQFINKDEIEQMIDTYLNKKKNSTIVRPSIDILVDEGIPITPQNIQRVPFVKYCNGYVERTRIKGVRKIRHQKRRDQNMTYGI